MKKFITLIFAFVMSMAAFAQSEHMKFMGIPLDGTISDFQSKLLAKGATQNSRLNAQYPFGVVAFNGVFKGENANFFIYHGKESDIVYRAKVSITKKYEEKFEEKYEELKKYIRATYKGIEKIDECCGHESYSVMVGNGAIQLTTSEVVENKQRVYVIYIDYVDKNNLSKCDVTLFTKIKNEFQYVVNQNKIKANSEHMKFMGIPIDGTVDAFQEKLAARGITLNKRINADIPAGGRLFKGNFAGYNARIYVYYDENTKIVYRVKVSISERDENTLEKKYDEFKGMISRKYRGTENISDFYGHEYYSVQTDIGLIQLYVGAFVENDEPVSSIDLDYTDSINQEKYEKSHKEKKFEDVLLDKINKKLHFDDAHMKFMGITLDGTINTFQSKLAAKGITPNVSMSKSLPVGCRAFDGDFAGYKATILVVYEKKSKVVYAATACMLVKDEVLLEQRYNEFKNLLKRKYDGEEKYGEENGHETYSVETELGVVTLMTSEDESTGGLVLQIVYYDFENYRKYRESQLDDI